jgi:AcrR family transcriptional regulator
VADTRTRILDEATRQLTELGYEAFTVASVRDALGLSSGSMFHAFASKAALAAAVYVEGMSDYQRAASQAIHGSDAEAALRQLIAVHLAWMEDHRALARYLFGTLPDEVMALAKAPLAERNAEFFATLDGLYQRASEAGLCGRLEQRLALALCIGPAQEYGRQWTRGNASVSPRKVTRAMQDAAIAALASTLPSPHKRIRKQEETL